MQCYKCGFENVKNAKYCTNCGIQIRGERIDSADTNKKYFTRVLALFLCVAVVIVFSFRDLFNFSLFTYEYLFNGLLFAIIISFLLSDYKSFLSLLRFNIRVKPAFFIIIGAPLLAFIVNVLANAINSVFSSSSLKYYEAYSLYTEQNYLFGILFISIMPGFFEEFLFRGLLFNNLLKLARPKTVILITSILFAFIHFSLLSFFWLFFIGLVLGYLRLKYRTIWYSIFFHSFYNASIFFIEMFV